MFICPVCKQSLERSGGAYVCTKGHSFDISRRGYVNLLCTQSSKIHGDDKEMTAARRDFLNGGYYRRLRDSVSDNIDKGPVADICCGEGYYMEGFASRLADIGGSCIYGVDISRPAVDGAARRKYAVDAFTAVANCTALPLGDESIATAVSMFAPLSESEMRRILKPDGTLIRVLPGRDHLIELKREIYDSALINPPFDNTLQGFTLKTAQNLRYSVTLGSNADICNLFTMTPYFYRTSQQDRQKLKKLNTLDVTLHFYIFIYKKSELKPEI